MIKSQLIQLLAAEHALPERDAEAAVREMLECMSEALAGGGRLEVRGFGSMSLHYRLPRHGRNPRTGEKVYIAGKYVPHFKPGKELRGIANRQSPAGGGGGEDGDVGGDSDGGDGGRDA
ncbi:MAG: integration host factor subunit beta [Gammaproteobacteria bacterium]|nr:integration host factor subunit beta [Gammaproteobacteria bacterium]MDD9850779.1 integration host factor subunit beta [Gammaproteobacteria bacterium]MDD9870249.1 integration host factor subunit beta [Gammaproteobacteria bacterium]